MKFEGFLTLLGDGLQIRLGRSEVAFNGSVVKTLFKDGVSVGVTKKLDPVFVRIDNAVEKDEAFKSIHQKVLQRAELSKAERSLIFTFAMARMREVYDGYRAGLRRKIAIQDKKLGRQYDKTAKMQFKAIVSGFGKAITEKNAVKIETCGYPAETR